MTTSTKMPTPAVCALHQYLRRFQSATRLHIVGPLATPQRLPEPVLFIDGGCHFRRGDEGLAIGDGDSYAGAMQVQLDPVKDFSDLAFTLTHINQPYAEIVLSGFLGRRRDHELFNLGESHRFLQARTTPTRLRFDHAVLAFSPGRAQFTRVGGFSLAVFADATLQVTGACHYRCPTPINLPSLASHGLSNIGYGIIHSECDQPLFVLFEEDDGGS